MRIGIPKEIHAGERRVAATPESVIRLRKMGFSVSVESGAGESANFSDAKYIEAGASVVEDVEGLWSGSDVVLKVRPPEHHAGLDRHEADLLRRGARLICFVWPAQNGELLERFSSRGVTVLAMDCVPRITRAQRMDALSAMANVAGYRAVVEAAHLFPRFFTGQVTAAGKIPPAKVLVIGAGVAGLSAIGAARGLGAIVRAFDTRAEVRDQVRSMGAEFLELQVEEEGSGEGGYAKVMSPAYIKAEMELFARQAIEVDIIITTALIPGKRAPELITAGMVESMQEGSVVVDLAAEQGGNCALTRPGEIVVRHGVSIVGYTDLPSRMASQSSQLYANCLVSMLDELKGPAFMVDYGNEIIRGSLVAHDGEVTWPPPKPERPADTGVGMRALKEQKAEPAQPASARAKEEGASVRRRPAAIAGVGLLAGLLVLIGLFAPATLVTHLTVFVLAIFVGWLVIWNVTPALHTPLMSVTNAISGIIIIGGMLQLRGGTFGWGTWLGLAAVLIATINVAGGFLVTRRMLAMFRR